MGASRFPSTVSHVLPRVVAGQVVLLAALALAFQATWLLPLLAIDFALRSLINPCWSPLAAVGRFVVDRLLPGHRRVSFAPKRFAAGIGLVLLAIASVLVFIGQPVVAWSLIGVLLLFAMLEAALGFCAGCVVYMGLVRLGVFNASECEECANWFLRAPDDAN